MNPIRFYGNKSTRFKIKLSTKPRLNLPNTLSKLSLGCSFLRRTLNISSIKQQNSSQKIKGPSAINFQVLILNLKVPSQFIINYLIFNMKFNPGSFLFFSILCQILLFFGQATSCEAGYYLENNATCISCGEGKSSPEGALSIDQCLGKKFFNNFLKENLLACADKGCKSCKGITTNACLVCDLDYSLQNYACISSSTAYSK